MNPNLVSLLIKALNSSEFEPDSFAEALKNLVQTIFEPWELTLISKLIALKKSGQLNPIGILKCCVYGISWDWQRDNFVRQVMKPIFSAKQSLDERSEFYLLFSLLAKGSFWDVQWQNALSGGLEEYQELVKAAEYSPFSDTDTQKTIEKKLSCIAENLPIEEITLNLGSEPEKQNERLKKITEALKKNTHLKTLTIKITEQAGSFVFPIAKSLKVNGSLQTLCIFDSDSDKGNNKALSIPDKFFRELARNLRTNLSLATLSTNERDTYKSLAVSFSSLLRRNFIYNSLLSDYEKNLSIAEENFLFYSHHEDENDATQALEVLTRGLTALKRAEDTSFELEQMGYPSARQLFHTVQCKKAEIFLQCDDLDPLLKLYVDYFAHYPDDDINLQMARTFFELELQEVQNINDESLLDKAIDEYVEKIAKKSPLPFYPSNTKLSKAEWLKEVTPDELKQEMAKQKIGLKQLITAGVVPKKNFSLKLSVGYGQTLKRYFSTDRLKYSWVLLMLRDCTNSDADRLRKSVYQKLYPLPEKNSETFDTFAEMVGADRIITATELKQLEEVLNTSENAILLDLKGGVLIEKAQISQLKPPIQQAANILYDILDGKKVAVYEELLLKENGHNPLTYLECTQGKLNKTYLSYRDECTAEQYRNKYPLKLILVENGRSFGEIRDLALIKLNKATDDVSFYFHIPGVTGISPKSIPLSDRAASMIDFNQSSIEISPEEHKEIYQIIDGNKSHIPFEYTLYRSRQSIITNAKISEKMHEKLAEKEKADNDRESLMKTLRECFIANGVYAGVMDTVSASDIKMGHSRVLSAHRIASISSQFTWEQVKLILKVEYEALPKEDRGSQGKSFFNVHYCTIERAIEITKSKLESLSLGSLNLIKEQNLKLAGSVFETTVIAEDNLTPHPNRLLAKNMLAWIGAKERSFSYKVNCSNECFNAMQKLGNIAHQLVAYPEKRSELASAALAELSKLPSDDKTKTLIEFLAADKAHSSPIEAQNIIF